MLNALGSILAVKLRRLIPDAFVFALLLTLLVGLLALLFADAKPKTIIDSWYKGFWILLEFGMQMVLMLTTGFAIALSPAIARLIDKVALLARGPGAVYFIVGVVGGLFALVSWGWAVLTAVLARELASRIKGVDYAYLAACAYCAGTVWVSGLSSSIPLALNTEGNFLIKTGVLESTIPVTNTLGSTMNALYMAVFFLTVPALLYLLRPRAEHAQTIEDLCETHAIEHVSIEDEAIGMRLGESALSDRLNNSQSLVWLIAAAGFWYIVDFFWTQGFNLDLNIMIFVFINVGLLMHRTPIRYVIAMKRACANVSGIIFQYPFYAGIMGIMMFTGLGAALAEWLASSASLATLPVIAQLSGALVNMAIPSAGGEWAVIGPSITESAKALSADLPPGEAQDYIARIAMAVAYGETSTNLLQPFFLLAILPIMGAGVRIQARDVMGYLVLPFVWVSTFTALIVSFAPL
ncbi:MAG: short-chain fatty acids transporter [Gammaproteobacteria bacterium]|jgi:short-chain fatty acids transporter